jgi:POT family proton-dependent oligopeptide transporter
MSGQLENKPAVPAAPPAVSTRHPIGFWFFFWGEFSERASFYGMRTILALYLTSVLGFAARDAGPIQYRFKAAAYFLPLLGGFVADRFFGKYWTIVGFSIPYVLGHFILGIPHPIAVYIALALLAGGSGVIKPNISTLMGQTYDEQRPGQEKLLSSAFLWFYFAINVGSLISTFALPALRDHYAGPNPDVAHLQHAYAIAFQFPAWLMVAALIVFAAGKPFYAKETRSRRKPTPEERHERWTTLGKLAGIFTLIIFFWVPYEHNDTIWVYFIRDYVNLPFLHDIPFFGSANAEQRIPPDQVQSLNPLCVLIFAPLCVWFFRMADPKGRIFTATNRMLIGFLMGVVSSGLMWTAGWLAASAAHVPPGAEVPQIQKISIFWPAASYIVLTLGEVLVYGTGLELAYTAAPKSMKGFITGCFLATIMIADIINDRMSQLYGGSLVDLPKDRGPFSPAQFFGLMTLIAVAAMIGFYFVGRRLRRQSAAEESRTAE